MNKKSLLLILCFLLLLLLCPPINNSFSIEPEKEKPSVFYGSVCRLGNFDYFLLPDYFDSTEFIEQEISENSTEIRLQFKNNHLESIVTEKVLLVGDWDFENSCIDVLFFKEDVERFSGEFKNGYFYTFGKSYFPVFASNFVSDKAISASNSKKIDIFGKKFGKIMLIHAVLPRKVETTTISGKIRKTDLGELFFVKKERLGRKITSTEFELLFDDYSQIFEGRNRIDFHQIIPGRITICDGVIDNNSKTILVNSLICNADQATDGGRMIGMIMENNGKSLKIKTVINQIVQFEFMVSPGISSWIVHNGNILNYKELLKIPVNFPVEVIGVFSDIDGEIDLNVLQTNPKKSSDFVFGVWDEETENITDYYGKSHKAIINDHTWIYSPGGALVDNTVLLAWISDEKVIGLYVPELGLMGVRMTGWFEGHEKGVISLYCLGSIDYDLQGQIIEINCDKGCKIIKGGFGFVDVKSLEKGTLLHCWGIPDFSGKFDVLMISVH